MSTEVDSYKLGSIEVTITRIPDSDKLRVVCNDGNFRSEFTVRRYEYKNYKRHMNQRITNAFRDQYGEEE